MLRRSVNCPQRDQLTVNELMPKRIDLAGQRFGRLVVIEGSGHRRRANGVSIRMWLCNCDCGGRHLINTRALTSGHTKSCGCLQSENGARQGAAKAIHGHRRAKGLEGRTYRTWQGMMKRCNSPKSQAWEGYGGRGVRVCDRWDKAKGGSYESFLADMGLCPSFGHSIDKDKLGDGMLYSPETCCWLTVKEQNKFRRSNFWVTYQGEMMILQEVVDLSGINRGTIEGRIKRGWAECDWFIPAGAKRTEAD